MSAAGQPQTGETGMAMLSRLARAHLIRWFEVAEDPESRTVSITVVARDGINRSTGVSTDPTNPCDEAAARAIRNLDDAGLL